MQSCYMGNVYNLCVEEFDDYVITEMMNMLCNE